MDPITLALIGGGLASTIANGYAAQRAERNSFLLQANQLNFADYQAKLAYIRQNEMQDKMNLYNSPVQQKQRLEAAGLNPALLYGNGGSVAQAATANVQQASTPSPAQAINYYAGIGDSISAGVNNVVQLQRLANETKVADAQAANLRAQANLSHLDAEYSSKTLDGRVLAQNLANQLTKSQVSKNVTESQLNEMRHHLTSIQSETERQRTAFQQLQNIYQGTLNKHADAKLRAEISEILARAQLAKATGNYQEMATSLQQFNSLTQRMQAEAARRNAATNAATQKVNERQGDERNQIDREARTEINNQLLFKEGADILGEVIDVLPKKAPKKLLRKFGSNKNNK